MITIRGPQTVSLFVLVASLGMSYRAAGQSSPAPSCPNTVGICASFGQDRMMCAGQRSQAMCVPPPEANSCSNGQVCPVGTACGNIGLFVPEDGRHFFPCFASGPVVVHDGAVGGPCKSVDDSGVTHVCKSARCSADSLCLADPPLNLPPSPGG